jgi:hypothetical protein
MAQRACLALALAALLFGRPAAVHAEVTAQQVRDAIERGKDYLLRTQKRDGSWRELDMYPGGISALCVVALVYSGVPPEDPAIRRAVEYLRTIPPQKTYTVAVQTMAFAAASPERDFLRIQSNAEWLQRAQIKTPGGSGMWGYDQNGLNGGDNSNTQYALLALRDAAELGVPIDPLVWRRAEAHWRTEARLRADGGWGYRGQASSGSMTVAGIASLIIVGSQLEQGRERIQPNGKILHCGDFEIDPVLERAFRWMDQHFSVMVNPNFAANHWWLYYMYGLERAGRLSGRRFFGKHDWFREGADVLVNRAQDRLSGQWKSLNPFESQYPELATAFALLFLSKGKSPVVINKLEFGSDWNNDRHDVPHLTEFLSRHWKLPLHRRLTWQIVNLDAATADDLLEAPIAYFNGHQAPRMDDASIEVLREYVEAGGTILAEACCSRPEFDTGFRELVRRMYPEGDFQLRPIGPEHPIWRSDFLIDPASSRPLWGLEFGCRTAIIYSPEDLSCFWEQWSSRSGEQQAEIRSMIDKALSIGTNIVAYATGQEFDDKLDRPTQIAADTIPVPENSRSLLPIAQLRHSGGADAAPKALPNLMIALHGLVPGVQVNPSPPDLAVLDPQLADYPLLYMHGRSAFRFGAAEVKRLREYLDVGGVLFADATCGSDSFDRSFRELCAQLYPETPLERIAVDHPLFKSAAADGAWFDLSEVTRREPLRVGPNDPLRPVTRKGEPQLEAVYHDGRFVVIYSPLDISCALEHSQDVKCRGYIHEDALRIAVNVVIYALHYQ